MPPAQRCTQKPHSHVVEARWFAEAGLDLRFRFREEVATMPKLDSGSFFQGLLAKKGLRSC